MTNGKSEAHREVSPDAYLQSVVHDSSGHDDQLSQPEEASSQEAQVEHESSLIKHTHEVANSFHLLDGYVCQALCLSVYLPYYLILTAMGINFLFYKQGNRLRSY